MANLEEKQIRIIRGNVQQVVYPLHVIKEIVTELDSKKLSIPEAIKKYGVIPATVKNWLRKYSIQNESEFIRSRIPKTVKKQAVREIESDLISRKEAAKKYKVDASTISIWLKLYSCNVKINIENMQELAEKDSRETLTVKEENGALRLAVDELKLKVTALETMIDVAEKGLNIEIRKKSGIKQ